MKIRSLIIFSLALIVYGFVGLIDINPVTTNQLASNRLEFKNKQITLRNVAVVGYKTKKINGDILLVLDITNTHRTFLKPKKGVESVTVLARANPKSRLLVDLTKFERWWFPKLKVKVTDKSVFLAEIPLSSLDFGSWLTTPYDLSVKILNQFLSLQLSIICALIIQLAITLIVILLVIEGIVYVSPF